MIKRILLLIFTASVINSFAQSEQKHKDGEYKTYYANGNEVSVSAKNGGTFSISKSMLEGYQLQDELAKEKIYAKINIEPNGNVSWVGFEKKSTSRDIKYKNAIIYCLPKINFEKASIAYQAICVFDFNGPLTNTLEKDTKSSDLTTDDEEDIKVFTKVEQEAYFPGGDAAWKAFLNNTIKANLRKSNGAPKGTYDVIVRFIVDKNGNVSDVAPETSYGYGMEAEAVRIMKASPKWEPARQNGKKVYSYKRQIISF